MSSVLGKRARARSNPSPLAAKRAPPAKRRCTDRNSNTSNTDNVHECPDKKPLPLATHGDTPKTPTKKSSPSQQHFSPLRLLLTRVICSKINQIIQYYSSQRQLQPRRQAQPLMRLHELSCAQALRQNVQAGRSSETPSRLG